MSLKEGGGVVMAASGLVVDETQGAREWPMLLCLWGLGWGAGQRPRALSLEIGACSKALSQVRVGQGFGTRAVSPAVWSGLH